MRDGPPIGIWLAADSRGAPAARALAHAMSGARLVAAGWRFGRPAPPGRRTSPASLEAWLAGEGLRPARETAASTGDRRPARAMSLAAGAALIVCGPEPWDGALPRLLARRPDLRVVALAEAATRDRWPEFYPAAAARGAPAAMASTAALVVLPEAEGSAHFGMAARGARPVLVEPLPSRLAGTEAGAACPSLSDRPYMVACGPIEARANTLLLLHLWREGLARGASLPKLVLVGERGPQVEEIAPLLDWNAALRPLVAEAPGLPPAALRRLIENARAVLVPDFAGPPAVLMRDLLALGVPMLAADTPAARRLGIAPRLDPLDGPGWRAAIAAAAATRPSPHRTPPPLPDWPGYAVRLLAAIRGLP